MYGMCVCIYIYIHTYAYIYAFTTCMCITVHVYVKKEEKKVFGFLCQYIISVFWSIYLHVYSIQPWKTSRCFLNMMCNVAPWAFTLLLWCGQSKVAPVKRFCPTIPWLIIIDPFKLQVSLVYAPWTNGQTHVDTYKCKCTYFLYIHIVLYTCIYITIYTYAHKFY